jgi:hypothetical protein
MVCGDGPARDTPKTTPLPSPAPVHLDIPADWKVQNTPAQVSLSTENGNTAVILRRRRAENGWKILPRKRPSRSRTHLHLERAATINGLAAFEINLRRRPGREGNPEVRLSYIQKGGDLSFSKPEHLPEFSDVRGTFQVVHSFKS